jgi:hypothetical protein
MKTQVKVGFSLIQALGRRLQALDGGGRGWGGPYLKMKKGTKKIDKYVEKIVYKVVLKTSEGNLFRGTNK